MRRSPRSESRAGSRARSGSRSGSRSGARPGSRSRSRDLLLLAAFPPELAGLDRRPPPGVRCATTGAGALAAAATTARLLAERPPARVLFLGTCGAYRPGIPVGAIVAVREAIAISTEELSGAAYRPAIERTRFPATLALPFPPATAAVPPAITRSRSAAARLARIGEVEHLEVAGVFAACHGAGVPCGAALAVANRVGPGAHSEWTANHRRVSRALVDALRRAGLLGPAARRGPPPARLRAR